MALDYKDFIGISNSKDLKRIPAGYFRSFLNVDSDDNKKLFLRRGKTEGGSTSTHSMWSNKFICLCVQNGDLKEVVIDLNTYVPTFTTILTGVGDTEMQYQTVTDMVIFSNVVVTGYIRGHVAYPFPAINQEFKARMVGGHLLEYANNRLWVFHDNFIAYSDAGRPMIRDTRHNYLQFGSRGRMVRAVAGGLFVSDGERCMYFGGGSGDPPTFKRIDITDTPCIEGMAITVDDETVYPGVQTKVVYWATSEGLYRGDSGGQVIQVTKEHFKLDGAARGRAIMINRVHAESVFRQYLATYDFNPGYGGMRMSLKMPVMEMDAQI